MFILIYEAYFVHFCKTQIIWSLKLEISLSSFIGPSSVTHTPLGIVGLRGPDPGLEFARNQQNPLTTNPFGNHLLAQAKVSLEAVWWGVGTRFPHPERG